MTLVSPAAQPDGSILYTYTPYLGTGGDPSPRVERLGPEGAVAVVLRGATFPAPTPDGQRLVYVKSTARGDALAIANGDGSGQRELLGADRFLGLAYPRVSPDGTRVAFVATVDVPPPDPNGPLELCARAPPLWAASASPRAGRARRARLAELCAPEAAAHRGSAHGLPWDVWLMRLDGGDLQRVSYLLEDEPSLAWSPDGRWLAVQGGGGLTLIEVASGRADRLAPYTAYGAIDWAAD